MRCRSHVRMLVLAALFCLPVSFAQTGTAPPSAPSAPTSPETTLANDTSHCQSLAAGDPRMAPLADVCEFALTYLHQLPDFVCEQTTALGGGHAVMKAQVRFENGRESLSDLTLSGKLLSANPPARVKPMNFFSSGELGSDLVDLFTAPIAAEFQFRKHAKLGNVPALVYAFHLPAAKNTFWAIRDDQGWVLRPEYKGELWVEQSTGRLLRLELEAVHLPRHFGFTTCQKTIDYNQITITDAGLFLLPSKSEAVVCTFYSGPPTCRKNVLAFHDCRKFGTTTRIITDNPQQ